MGHATNIITGLSVGLESTGLPVIVISVAIIGAYYLGETSGIKNTEGKLLAGLLKGYPLQRGLPGQMGRGSDIAPLVVLPFLRAPDLDVDMPPLMLPGEASRGSVGFEASHAPGQKGIL